MLEQATGFPFGFYNRFVWLIVILVTTTQALTLLITKLLHTRTNRQTDKLPDKLGQTDRGTSRRACHVILALSQVALAHRTEWRLCELWVNAPPKIVHRCKTLFYGKRRFFVKICSHETSNRFLLCLITFPQPSFSSVVWYFSRVQSRSRQNYLLRDCCLSVNQRRCLFSSVACRLLPRFQYD